MSDDAEVLEGISTGMVPAGSLGYMACLDIDNPGFKPHTAPRGHCSHCS